MSPEQRNAFNHLIKQLEAMSASGAVPADYAKDSSLQDIENAINVLKDGEFRILSDPNDNDRLVGLTVDLTDPQNPEYIYVYLDDNTVYAGNVNDLETGTVSQSNKLVLYREPQYYLKNSAPFVANPTVNGSITFGYKDKNGSYLFDDSGALAGGYASLANFITAINNAQSIFEFYELSDADIALTGTSTGIIGIRSKDYQIPSQWVDQFGLSVDGGGFDATLFELADKTTTLDQVLRRLIETKAALLINNNTANGTLAYIQALYNIQSLLAATAFDLSNTNFDAAYRLRTSELKAIFNSKFTNGFPTMLWDSKEVSGTGTTVDVRTTEGKIVLNVGADAGVRVLQTYMRFPCISGQSMIAYINLTPQGAGFDSGHQIYAGLGDAENGIFFKNSGGFLQFGYRSTTSSSFVEYTTVQPDWNINPNVAIDYSVPQTIVIDYHEGLGVVRFGFKFGNKIEYVHAINVANSTFTFPLIASMNLPFRFELSNNGTSGSTGFDCFGVSLFTEGKEDIFKIPRYLPAADTALECTSAGTYYMLKAFAINPDIYQSINNFLKGFITCSSDNAYEWFLVKNPIIDDTINWTPETNGCLYVADGISVNVVSDLGEVITGGLLKDSYVGSASQEINLNVPIRLGFNIAGDPDIFAIVIRSTGNNTQYRIGITKEEQV